jgi:hypothetical protein
MGVILGFLGMILLGLFIRLLGVEIGVYHTPLCQWLVRIAAGRLPLDERAAAESEWLAVIEDLRSPTAQLLHSLSYVLSAFRIREAIEPRERGSLVKTVLSIQVGVMGIVTGATSSIVFAHKNKLAGIVREHLAISKPEAVAILIVLLLISAVTAYANHRLLIWYLGRRARRRANMPIE